MKVITAYQKTLHTQSPLLCSSLRHSSKAAACSLCLGNTRDLQVVTILTITSSCHLPSAPCEVPSTGKKLHSTKRVKISTKPQPCFSWWHTHNGKKADQMACWVLSRPLPLQHIKLIFFKPAFYHQCSHTRQNNLLTKTCTNKQPQAFKNETTQKKQEQERLFLYSSWKGASLWMTE